MELFTRIITNLRTIASISHGMRLNTTREFLTIESDTFLTPLFRTVMRDGRERAKIAVIAATGDAMEYGGLLMESRGIIANDPRPMSNPRIQMICEIQDALNASIIGIENLRETYADSTETVAYLEQQVKKIRSYMEKSGEFLLPMGIVTNIGATGSIDIERLMITHSPSG